MRSIFLSIPLCLLATACGPRDPSELDPTSSDNQASSSGTYGVDYSFYRPNPSSLVADGYKFVARYYCYDNSATHGKILFKPEADALIGAGLNIVGNFEDGATNALNGYNQGVSDAKVALAQADAVGQPSNRPIYFSIDFDASVYGLGAFEPYFEGVAAVIGLDRTGAYGGYSAISRLFDAGKIRWGWQTYAWSNGVWDSRAQFRQTDNGILGGQADLDQAIAGDFGQWGHYSPGVRNGAYLVAGRVSENSDGHLELVYRGTDNTVHHQWQGSAGGSWGTSADLSGLTVGSNPVMAANADGRLEVFVVGADKKVYTNFQKSPGGSWFGWITLGGDTGEVQGDIAVGTNSDGRLEAFGRGLNDALYHSWQTAPNGGWSNWSSLGGKISTDPTVGINADGRLEVFAVEGTQAWHIVQLPGGGWSGWLRFPASTAVTGAMIVGSNHDGREELFALGADHAIHHAWQTSANGDWGGWASLGGSLESGPGVILNPTGQLEIFAEASNGVLYHAWQTTAGGSWSAWDSYGDTVDSRPAAAINKDGVVQVFAEGTSKNLEAFTRASNGTWSTANLGDQLASF